MVDSAAVVYSLFWWLIGRFSRRQDGSNVPCFNRISCYLSNPLFGAGCGEIPMILLVGILDPETAQKAEKAPNLRVSAAGRR